MFAFSFTLLTFFFSLGSNWHFILFDSFYFVIANVISAHRRPMCAEPNLLYTKRFVFEIYTFISICMRWNVWLHLFICIFLPLGLNKNISFSVGTNPFDKIFQIFWAHWRGLQCIPFFWPLPMLCGWIFVHRVFLLTMFAWKPSNIETFPFGQTFDANRNTEQIPSILGILFLCKKFCTQLYKSLNFFVLYCAIILFSFVIVAAAVVVAVFQWIFVIALLLIY